MIGQFVLKFLKNKYRGVRFYVIVQVKCKGMRNLRFLTNISLYFENGTRYSHSNDGRRIGARAFSSVQFSSLHS